MPLQTVARTFAGVTIVQCTGRLVLGEESANLRHLVKGLLTESKQIVLDLGGVAYIDSSGLGVLVALYASAQNAGGVITLANLNPRLRDMLQITKLLTVFEVFDKPEDAIAAFNPNAGQSKPAEWY
jgi:anti-sigma B factor antagonist